MAQPMSSVPQQTSLIDWNSTYHPTTAFPSFQPNAQKQSFMSKVGSAIKDLPAGAINGAVQGSATIGRELATPLVLQAQGSNNASLNANTDSLQSVLDRMKTETDPVKKQALNVLAHKLVNNYTGLNEAGNQINNASNAMDAPSTVQAIPFVGGKLNLQQQQQGGKGIEGIAGDAIQTAALIAPGASEAAPAVAGVADAAEGAGGAGDAADAAETVKPTETPAQPLKPSLGTRIASTAKEGAGIGGAFGAGNAMTQGGSAEDVVKGGLEGVGIGAGLGVGSELIGEGAGAAKNAIKGVGKTGTADAQTIAESSIENPLTPTEFKQAELEDRVSVGKGSKNIITPDAKTASMQEAVKPLAEDGTLKDPNVKGKQGMINQQNNVSATGKAIDDLGGQIRSSAKSVDSTTGNTYDANRVQQANDQIDEIQPSKTLKSDKALKNRITDFNSAVKEIVKEESDKGTGAAEANLNIRQGIDKLIKTEMPKTFNDDPIATAMEKHALAVRNIFNENAAKEFDAVPDQIKANNAKEGTGFVKGSDYRAALRRQGSLIDAQKEMAIKYAREFPQDTSASKQFWQEHPTLHRLVGKIGLREATGLIGGGLGLTYLTSEVSKAVKSGIQGK